MIGSTRDGVHGGSNVITISAEPTLGHAGGGVSHVLLQETDGGASWCRRDHNDASGAILDRERLGRRAGASSAASFALRYGEGIMLRHLRESSVDHVSS